MRARDRFGGIDVWAKSSHGGPAPQRGRFPERLFCGCKVVVVDGCYWGGGRRADGDAICEGWEWAEGMTGR